MAHNVVNKIIVDTVSPNLPHSVHSVKIVFTSVYTMSISRIFLQHHIPSAFEFLFALPLLCHLALAVDYGYEPHIALGTLSVSLECCL